MPLIMTLASIKHSPPPSISSQTANHSRWRRGLAMFTKWSQNSRNKKRWDNSPTALAAATEKVCHRHASSTIKCEDLTAKEFAQLTGIKIRTTDDTSSNASYININDDETENEDEEEAYYATAPLTTDLPINAYQFSVQSARSAQSSESRAKQSLLRIWDSDYWHHQSHAITFHPAATNSRIHPTKSKSVPVQPIPIHSSACSDHTALSSVGSTFSAHSSSGSTEATSYTSHDTPFLSHIRRQSTFALDPTAKPQQRATNVIKKGRFQIVLGHDHDGTDEQVIALPEQVVEWKRKRIDG
ncbi:hypothetical protein J3Q64DRAFT_1697546 [Phycomyces blakesleeanus]|uniref:Uncharacterized protein n=2 Tax=Phycomyces blakesleeanus TaxID=4837 RepID=A0A162TLE3_PHYB8|nr:hypothetical protein PHYBLDRAFT_188260 [Phycomyces blakesleeanus NRRL 1555(-)]OAD69472.1 hypothetical protein PHYBLDRAFT_188260 [Phycomyces blakesleeanus NRRL 1555(-)]|eukprot:XP_018287512.1 hypothetical protein PHYBLDRAFT_188260 [Phycomyces blakesleeanus NRRL 1555(-)]